MLQAMTKLEASIVEKVKGHTRGAVANIGLSSPQEDRLEGDNSVVVSFKRIVRRDMVSFRSMSTVRNDAMDAVLSEMVIGRIAEEASQ